MRTLADPDKKIHQPSLLNADLGTSIPGLNKLYRRGVTVR